MKTARLTHMRLCVDDVAACYAFYRDVVGLTPMFDATGSVYAELRTGGATLALFKKELMAQAVGTESLPAHAGGQDEAVVCLYVDDVDAAAAELKSRGVAFVREPHDQPHWRLRVAHFRDPAGNLIELSQDMPHP